MLSNTFSQNKVCIFFFFKFHWIFRSDVPSLQQVNIGLCSGLGEYDKLLQQQMVTMQVNRHTNAYKSLNGLQLDYTSLPLK